MKKNRKKQAGKQKPAGLKISRRLVDRKRHTRAYIVGGKRMTVAQATKLASQGKISGVRVVGNHIQSETGRKCLSTLPTTVQS